MKSVLILGAAAALLASCSSQSKKENSSADIQKPNVIFLVADDIGFGDFSCNGATEVNTPNVDKLAAQGIRLRMRMRLPLPVRLRVIRCLRGIMPGEEMIQALLPAMRVW